MPERCMGCGGLFEPVEGSTHDYMLSSPACFAAFGDVLAAEYSIAELMAVHRLTVDAYALQHPGNPADRRAVQSVGLHLARLMRSLEMPRGATETNVIMLDFSKHKSSLVWLEPPKRFRMTVADVVPYSGTADHTAMVQDWGRCTWEDWAAHHDYIRQWVGRNPA